MRVSHEVWYVANDGSRHTNEADAVKRDALIVAVDAIMAPLGERVKDEKCNFANGGGYVRHDPAVVRSVKGALGRLTMKEHSYIDPKGCAVEDVHPSWWGRMLDGMSGPLDRAWSRLYCIGDDGREWGQPYYASHPTEGTQKEWTR